MPKQTEVQTRENNQNRYLGVPIGLVAQMALTEAKISLDPTDSSH